MTERLLVCRVAWMRQYRGNLAADRPLAGGSYVRTNVVSGEVINFRPYKGHFWGYVQAPRGRRPTEYGRLNLAKHFGISKTSEHADGVTVIWFATDPNGGGQKVVGIYRNARVLAEASEDGPDRQLIYRRKRYWLPYNIVVAETDALLIPIEARNCIVPRIAGAPGQSNASYLDANNRSTTTLRRRLLAYAASVFEKAASIEEEVKDLARGGGGQGMGLTADERNAVAERAVRVATKHYRKHKWTLIGEYRRTGPYDLLFRKDDSDLFVEVKGTTGRWDSVILTRGEVLHAQDERHSSSLVVVYEIQLNREAVPPAARRGSLHVVDPWTPSESDLTSLVYRYRLPTP